MLAEAENITDILFGDISADRMYYGDTLIYEKPPHYAPNQFVGKINLINDDDGVYPWVYLGTRSDIYVDRKTGEFSTIAPETVKNSYISMPNDLERVDHLPDLSEATTLSMLFSNYGYLESVSFKGVNTSNVTTTANMFNYCRSLKTLDLKYLDTSKVTNMEYMFMRCSGLTSINMKGWDTLSVINMRYMFSGCSSLGSIDLSMFRTANATTMEGMFNNCQSLKYIDLNAFNTSSLENISGMFSGCESLKTIDLSAFDTSKLRKGLTYVDRVFHGCSSLESLRFNEFHIGLSSDENSKEYNGFFGCTALTTVTGSMVISCDGRYNYIVLKDCPLTAESAMVFINGLQQVSYGSSISFKASTYDALTDEQIAIATSKNWSVIRHYE